MKMDVRITAQNDRDELLLAAVGEERAQRAVEHLIDYFVTELRMHEKALMSGAMRWPPGFHSEGLVGIRIALD